MQIYGPLYLPIQGLLFQTEHMSPKCICVRLTLAYKTTYSVFRVA